MSTFDTRDLPFPLLTRLHAGALLDVAIDAEAGQCRVCREYVDGPHNHAGECPLALLHGLQVAAIYEKQNPLYRRVEHDCEGALLESMCDMSGRGYPDEVLFVYDAQGYAHPAVDRLRNGYEEEKARRQTAKIAAEHAATRKAQEATLAGMREAYAGKRAALDAELAAGDLTPTGHAKRCAALRAQYSTLPELR